MGPGNIPPFFVNPRLRLEFKSTAYLAPRNLHITLRRKWPGSRDAAVIALTCATSLMACFRPPFVGDLPPFAGTSIHLQTLAMGQGVCVFGGGPRVPISATGQSLIGCKAQSFLVESWVGSLVERELTPRRPRTE